MNFSVYVLPVLAGYLFLIRCYYFRFSTLRASGYHVFLKSGLFGFVFFVTSFLLVDYTFPEFPSIQPYIAKVFGKSTQSKLVASCFISIPISGFILILVNTGYKEKKALLSTAYRIGAFTDVLFQESMRKGELIEVTTNNKKVYVGFILSCSPDLTGAYSEVFLLPIMSGYRKEKTMKVMFTTKYVPIYLQYFRSELGVEISADHESEELVKLLLLLSQTTNNKFRLAIPIRETVSARVFEYDVYKQFQHQGPQ